MPGAQRIPITRGVTAGVLSGPQRIPVIWAVTGGVLQYLGPKRVARNKGCYWRRCTTLAPNWLPVIRAATGGVLQIPGP